MRLRPIWKICIAICVSGFIGYMAFADSFDWKDKPVYKSKATFECSKGQPCWVYEEAWIDGSAIFKVVPMSPSWPEDKLPTTGLITVNDKTFKMAQRREDDKIILFGSIPVGTLDLTIPTHFTLVAYDANGVKLVDDEAGWE